ncbi:MAG: penicillin acylase family protein [Candidatus Eremiobacteraeota bacterium]|nr:penicillin acylase family protein [Candidatus Eremiobacteraeota bacterium]
MSITTRDASATLWRTLLALLFIALVAAIVWVVWFIRAPIPRLDGTLVVSGPTAPITIRRDDRGIPHIEAQTVNDALFGEGFACAQDRLWQMDTLRRQAEGRLSEFAGPAALDIDRYMRTLGLAEAAQANVDALDARSRSALQAYADGVNAAAASHRLPIEFKLLGYGWEPWRPVDTLAVVKLMGQRLDDQWYYIQVKASLTDKLGPQAAGALVDMQMPALERYIPGYGTGAQANPAAAVSLAKFRLTLGADPTGHERGTGSNNWAVSGARTTSHKPVLSNDTHLGRTLPSTWWTADLYGGQMHVAGFTLPGIPGIVIGHNERIAFGVTSAEEAVEDLYIERFRSPTSDEYFANGMWRKAEHRVERIGVKGKGDETLDVLVTRHGPVIKREGTRGLALAWTILHGGGEAQALFGVDVAQNFAQFRAALAHQVGPVLNFGYADSAGNIGYQDAGAVPLRAAGDGSLPVEGQDDRFAWRGTVPFGSLPHALNPRDGFVVTANQALVPPAFRPLLSTYFEPPFRANRIAGQLRGLRDASAQTIGAIQADIFDYPRWRLARETARLLAGSADPQMRALATQLQAWDGKMTADSRIPTFVVLEENRLGQDLLLPRFGMELYAQYDKHYWKIVPLLRVLDGDQRLNRSGLTKARVQTAVVAAAGEVTDGKGADGIGALEVWGQKNAAIYRHPLSAEWILGFLSIPPVREPGSGFSVYANKPDHGPSQRLVVDLADLDNSSMLLTLGESGVYSDPHYDDQLADYTDVHWAPLPFTQNAVSAATQHTLILNPK